MSISLTFNNPTQAQLDIYSIVMKAPMSESEFNTASEELDSKVYNLINSKTRLPIFKEICDHLLPTVKKRYFQSLSDSEISVDAIFEYYRRSCEPTKGSDTKSPYELYSIACMRKIIATLISQQFENREKVPFWDSEEFINLQIKMTQGGKPEDHYLEFLELLKKRSDLGLDRLDPPNNSMFKLYNAQFFSAYFAKTSERHVLNPLYHVFALEYYVDNKREIKYLEIPEIAKTFFLDIGSKARFFKKEVVEYHWGDKNSISADRKMQDVVDSAAFDSKDIYQCVEEGIKNQSAMMQLLGLSEGEIEDTVREIFRTLVGEHDKATLFFNNLLEVCETPRQEELVDRVRVKIHTFLVETQIQQGNFTSALEGIRELICWKSDGYSLTQLLIGFDRLLHLRSAGEPFILPMDL